MLQKDVRRYIALSTFGFYKGGTLDVNLTNFKADPFDENAVVSNRNVNIFTRHSFTNTCFHFRHSHCYTAVSALFTTENASHVTVNKNAHMCDTHFI